ncbi:MAG: CDP-glycerol glycerophosphotransferase family protein [Anaerovoracaceae bacterium]|nr:CDP-glycerol glycerophosphotransferase family protein [Bacillota bacterium]MEE0516634.1 CDP-glycerol glycerophosphotransferase family protein [Anaerovoracaceae bacterium]
MNIKVNFISTSIRVLNYLLSFIYFFIKLIPTKRGKILFLSRQSDKIPLDFVLLKNRIKQMDSSASVVVICSRVGHSAKESFLFFVQMIRSMYHLATSRVCIIDSYWPAVSMLKHKKNLKIIQIWHSIGKMKKSGYQSLDKKSGRKSQYAMLLKMHDNYDYFIGGAEIFNKYYCEAFRISEDKILNYGLPRIDYLIETEKQNRARFYNEFPELKDKKVVLYAPTFRRNMKSGWENILNADISSDIAVIIKNHPGQCTHKAAETSHIRYMDDWETIDLISACDYLITDYSSIAFEAAVLRKKTFFWIYDYEQYMENSGINIDLKKELSHNVFKNIDELMAAIENDDYSTAQQEKFIRKYLLDDIGHSTDKIAGLAVRLAESKENNNEVYNNGRWQGRTVEEPSWNIKTFGGDRRRKADMQDNKTSAKGNSAGYGNHSNVS